jgi:hypothetical protein
MFRLTLLPYVAFLTALPGLAASACDVALAANLKVYQVPVHLYMTESGGPNSGKTKNAETVYLDGSIYVMVNGRWRKSPVSPKDMAEAKKDTDQKVGPCTVVRDETVTGEAATLYKIHSQSDDASVDSEIWISKSKGLPLKQVNDMDVGGAFGRTHTEIRYEYSNVKAPAISDSPRK